jgi:biotin transport system substrate-specific component
VGFVLAAGIVGWFADQRNDRNYLTSLSSLFLASGVIYICGSLWLAYRLNIPVATGEKNAIGLGVAPFLVGDVIKALLAAAVAPLGWALYHSRPR